MTGIIWQEAEQVAVLHDLARPTIVHPLDAIVAISWSGLCGSDLHVYYGHERPDAGTIMGHEFVGTIVELGSWYQTPSSDASLATAATPLLEVGNRVVCPFTTSCGGCEPCLRGLTARCLQSQLLGWKSNGEGLSGAQAQYIRVPYAQSSLVQLPRSTAMRAEHLFLADILPTGFECISRGRIEEALATAERLDQPLRMAVVGLGPVGIMALLSLRYFVRSSGSSLAHTIVAIDAVDDRLDFVRERIPGVMPVNLADETALKFGGNHLVFEAVGGKGSPGLALAFKLCAPGATISSIGVHVPSEQPFPFSAVDCYDKNITMTFGRCSVRPLIPRLLQLLEDNAFDFDFASLISHRVPLEHEAVVDAYKLFASRKSLKIVFSVRPE